MTDKKKKDTGGEPEIVQVMHEQSEGDPLNQKFDVPGLVFRWVNLPNRERKGWKIWQPVWRDTEVGEQIAKQLGATFDKFAGLATDTNMFHLGNDTVLAFSTVEQNATAKAAKSAKAKDQLSMVDPKQMSHMYISTNKG